MVLSLGSDGGAQVPRLYHIHRKTVKDMNNFSTMMANIFEPLFEATRDPEAHPEVSLFLEQVRVPRFHSLDVSCGHFCVEVWLSMGV